MAALPLPGLPWGCCTEWKPGMRSRKHTSVDNCLDWDSVSWDDGEFSWEIAGNCRPLGPWEDDCKWREQKLQIDVDTEPNTTKHLVHTDHQTQLNLDLLLPVTLLEPGVAWCFNWSPLASQEPHMFFSSDGKLVQLLPGPQETWATFSLSRLWWNLGARHLLVSGWAPSLALSNISAAQQGSISQGWTCRNWLPCMALPQLWIPLPASPGKSDGTFMGAKISPGS